MYVLTNLYHCSHMWISSRYWYLQWGCDSLKFHFFILRSWNFMASDFWVFSMAGAAARSPPRSLRPSQSSMRHRLLKSPDCGEALFWYREVWKTGHPKFLAKICVFVLSMFCIKTWNAWKNVHDIVSSYETYHRAKFTDVPEMVTQENMRNVEKTQPPRIAVNGCVGQRPCNDRWIILAMGIQRLGFSIMIPTKYERLQKQLVFLPVILWYIMEICLITALVLAPLGACFLERFLATRTNSSEQRQVLLGLWSMPFGEHKSPFCVASGDIEICQCLNFSGWAREISRRDDGTLPVVLEDDSTAGMCPNSWKSQIIVRSMSCFNESPSRATSPFK